MWLNRDKIEENRVKKWLKRETNIKNKPTIKRQNKQETPRLYKDEDYRREIPMHVPLGEFRKFPSRKRRE
jgi:hypothetical protein